MNLTAPTNDLLAPRPTDDESRWAALTRRDAAADGTFFYSVRTTGVYCRPSCAARLPRRENVRFHATTADAEAAGFRPCKRCRPNEAPRADRRDALDWPRLDWPRLERDLNDQGHAVIPGLLAPDDCAALAGL